MRMLNVLFDAMIKVSNNVNMSIYRLSYNWLRERDLSLSQLYVMGDMRKV